MKRYRVTWKETHTQIVEAQNDEDILLSCDVGESVPTYKDCELEEVEYLSESELAEDSVGDR